MYSSYPHGGWVVSGMILSCIIALSSTLWGVASCRFAYVDFISDRGDFGVFYLDPTPDGGPVLYRAGVGLFTWLQPLTTDDWSKGQCTGYTVLQTDQFSDDIFEVARIFGVLSVLGGVGVTCWTLFLGCISLGRFQIWMLSGVLFFITAFVGLTFLIFQSALCQDLVSYQDESYTTQCTLDQGGLVIIASCILWCVAFLMSVIYIKPPELDLEFSPDGQIRNAFEQRQRIRQQQMKQRRLEQLLAQQKKQQEIIRQKRHMEQQQRQRQHRQGAGGIGPSHSSGSRSGPYIGQKQTGSTSPSKSGSYSDGGSSPASRNLRMSPVTSYSSPGRSPTASNTSPASAKSSPSVIRTLDNGETEVHLEEGNQHQHHPPPPRRGSGGGSNGSPRLAAEI